MDAKYASREENAMQEEDWKLLSVLYRHKSLSRASEELFVSQPALTRRLRQIEEEFRTVITIRSSRGVSFTSQGEELVRYAEAMLREYEKIKREVSQAEEISGTISIASSLSLTQFLLPGLLQAFKQIHPGVQFEVSSGLSQEIARQVTSRQVQVAFLSSDHMGVFQKDLLLCQPAYVVASQPFEIMNLPEMPQITYAVDNITNTQIDHWWYERFSCAPNTSMNVQNGNIAYEMMCHGLGYCIFMKKDYWIGNQDLCAKQMFFLNGMPVERRDWMAYRKETLQLCHVAAFVEFAKRYVREQQERAKAEDAR